MAEIGVRNQKPFDPEECLICTAEAEAVVVFDGCPDEGRTRNYEPCEIDVALCPFHLERLVDECRDWLGGEE